MSEFEKLSAKRKELQAQGEIPTWYTTQGFITFERKYSFKGETVRGAFERIADTLSKHYTVNPSRAKEKFFNLLWKGHLSPSTPVMSNTGTGRGLTVSCAGSYTGDSVIDFYDAYKETAILSQEGFGTSSYLGDIRPRGSAISRGGKADGVVPVIDSFLDTTEKISQGSSRRGAVALYLPVDHGDFWEVAGYTQKNPADTNIGWNFSDEVIEKLKSGDPEMIKRWNRVMYLRCRSGKGYMWKPDLANRLAPQAIKNSGITVKGSNLCNEIALPQDENHTFTCVLSSLNLAKWDEFDEDTVYWSIAFLDCVVSEMLENAKGKKGMEKAVRFTKKSRALGLGVMGLATLYQKRSLPFESLQAHLLNTEIFKTVRCKAEEASKMLADLYGEPEWCEGTGMRNATLMAVAPTMTSSILCGSVSQGIEPIVANAYNQRSAAGELTRMNPEFVKVAKAKGMYSDELMDDIAKNYSGSVQHLDWLSDHEKKVFKTAYEINQFIILRQASQRQRDIDQGQSLNFFVSANEDEKYIADLHKAVLLDKYLKGAYYLRSERGVKASKGECEACQ